jgi:hypothetical protein
MCVGDPLVITQAAASKSVHASASLAIWHGVEAHFMLNNCKSVRRACAWESALVERTHTHTHLWRRSAMTVTTKMPARGFAHRYVKTYVSACIAGAHRATSIRTARAHRTQRQPYRCPRGALQHPPNCLPSAHWNTHAPVNRQTVNSVYSHPLHCQQSSSQCVRMDSAHRSLIAVQLPAASKRQDNERVPPLQLPHIEASAAPLPLE